MKVLYISSGPSTQEYNNIKNKTKIESTNFIYGMPEASYKFNKLMIEGLVNNHVEVKSIVGRMVSRKAHRGLFWKKNKHIENGVCYYHLSFINLPIIKQLCICLGTFIQIMLWIIQNKKEECSIIIDGSYVSLIPIVNMFHNVNKIAIICDVYSYMANVKDARENISFKTKLISRIMKNQYQKIDGFVFLTEEMSKLDSFKNKPFIVIEGLVDLDVPEKNTIEKYIMYAGALREEYGLKRLIDAFRSIKNEDINLYLFGNGDYVSEIKKISKEDSRIVYKGKVSLNEIYDYEKNAMLLVNPRFALSEFTKYSFPSKNLEYMLSGTPLLTGKLPGMPKEYNRYVYLIENDSTESLKKSIEKVLKKSEKELISFGKKAQIFISKFKNKMVQTKKILDLNDIITRTKKENRNETIFQYSGITKYIPIIISGGFFLLTILLLMFGPYNWHISNTKQVYSFLILAFILLILGYILAIRYGKIYNSKEYIDINSFLKKCIVIFLIIYIPTLYIRTGKIYPDIVRGVFDSGNAYRLAHSSNQTLIEYIRIIFSPFIVMVIPLTILYFNKLNKFNKFFGILCIILTLFLGISCGISKQFADFVIQVFIFSILIFFSKSLIKTWKGRMGIIAILILTCFSFVMYYKTIMSNRIGSDIVENENIVEEIIENNKDKNNELISENNKDKNNELTSENIDNNKSMNTEIISENIIDDVMNDYASFGYATIKKENLIYKIIPQKFKSSFLYLISYITHGYKGLSFAMEKDFTSSYGLGFSEFIRHNFSRFFGDDFEDKIYQRTYMSKIEDNGWYTLNVWSTFFIYPASDIGFIMTLLLILFIGYAFGYSWKDAIISGNIFASCSFYNFIILVFYLSANNQLFQTGEAFVSSVFIFTTYVFQIYKRRCVSK